jgi:O-antigen ligase
MIFSSQKTQNAPVPNSIKKSFLLNVASSFGLVVAIPVVLAAFVIWQDSLARQLFAAAVLVVITIFALKKDKYIALTLAILFFTQFSTSLHSFELAEPLKFQIYFLDVLLLLWFFSSKEINKSFKTDKIGKIWILLIIWMVVTAYFSARTDKSILFFIMMLKALFVFLSARHIDLDDTLIRKFVIIVATILVIQGLLAGLQYVKKDLLGLVVLGERNPETSKMHFVKDSLRVSGTLGAVNALGGYISMLMVFITPFILAGKKNKFLYLIYGASYATLIIPFSRAGWLSYFIGTMICVINLLKSKSISFSKTLALGVVTGILLAGIVFVFMDKIVDRFEDEHAKASAEGRVGQFVEAMDVIERYPVLGIGPGVTEFFAAWKDDRKYVQKALPGVEMYNQYHNSFLQFWVENGVPGAILFIIFIAMIGLNAYKPSMHSTFISPSERLLVIGASSAAFSFLIHTSFGPEINNDRLLVAFALFLGLARNKKFIG